MIITRQAIILRQRQWVASRGIKPTAKGYLPTLEDNLFQPLNAETRAEFAAGNGNELGGVGRHGRMQAFLSSSALVCNVFDYWRSQLLLDQSLEMLTTALGAPPPINQIQFEQIYATGIRDTPPHLDIILLGDNSKPFLIESDFAGFYKADSIGDISTKSYFPNSGEIWGKHGLPRCEDLARRIHADQEQFYDLNAPLLLKHILGLVNTFHNDFTLLYLWYDYTSDYTATYTSRHRAEVETFMLRLNGEIDFRAMTYQDLFKKMQSTPAVDGNYIAYLAERYFA